MNGAGVARGENKKGGESELGVGSRELGVGEIFSMKEKPSKNSTNVIVWTGEKNRSLSLRRPCKCGCDKRAGITGVGYLTASDHNGNGFTLWLTDEITFKTLERFIFTGKKIGRAHV